MRGLQDPEPDLVSIPGYPFAVCCSPGVEDRARQAADRCAAAYGYLSQLLAFQPRVTLVVYAERDWPIDHPPFGLPYFDGKRVVVAGEDADFWLRFVPPLRQTSPEVLRVLVAVYGADLRLAPFFDLLAVHELGHAFHGGRQTSFPRHWLDELFANLCLHSYVVAVEPGARPVLVAFPGAFATVDASGFEWRTLAEFERVYSGMEGTNYGWFQSHFHVAARRADDAAGTLPLTRLWGRFIPADPDAAYSDTELANILTADVHAEVARVLTAWPVPSRADRGPVDPEISGSGR